MQVWSNASGDKMKEQFEKLPFVAKYLGFVFFNEETQGYCNKSDNYVPLDFASFLNGAWMAYQEQQKKIDAALELGYKTRRDVHYLVDKYINEVEELLK